VGAVTSKWAKAALLAAAVVVALVIGTQWPTTSPGGSGTTGPTATTLATARPSSSRTGSPEARVAPSATRSPRVTASPRPAPGATSQTTVPAASPRAKAVLDRMTLRQRVGQLFMVGTPATGETGSIGHAITDLHVGNVMMTGRSSLGVDATARLSKQLQSLTTRRATAGAPLLVSTDQEGGAVQVLQGPGFSRMPSAVTQGGWSPSQLRSQARDWGDQLAAAGITVNLAPVLDTVPSGTADANPPIGAFGREYGSDPAAVTEHGLAFADGMTSAGVVPVVKHFPGLGRVDANTDTSSGVTDHVTTRRDRLLRPFATAIGQGVPMVMMSTAVYARLDPEHPAAFSRRIVTGLLREQLGFGGVVISDDLGAARQVASWSPGERATQFIAAGGDLVLTVDGPFVAQMVSAVVDRAESDPGFRATVNASALRVLQLKNDRGLLGR
jgi:beta-N-acetylhexosaminidase